MTNEKTRHPNDPAQCICMARALDSFGLNTMREALMIRSLAPVIQETQPDSALAKDLQAAHDALLAIAQRFRDHAQELDQQEEA